MSLVEGAEEQAAPVQRLADRVAARLLPAVLVFLAVVYVLTQDVRKIVALLIFTSPAELGLATPMVMIAAVARAARLGILVQGGLYLERLAKVDAIVFDKTGTLTHGKPVLVAVVVEEPTWSENDVLALAAAADRRSAHPLAHAVVKAAEERGLALADTEEFQSIHGRGVVAVVDAREVIVGNNALLDERAVVRDGKVSPAEGMSVRVAVNGTRIASLLSSDEPKAGTREALAALSRSGVKRLVMLTGDNPSSAEQVAKAVGITEVRGRLLPEEKVKAIEDLQRDGLTVAMVGDGVNDAPVRARADVGIAMGVRGTQAAIEAADIALMTDDLAKIATARVPAKRAYRTIQENLLVGVGVVHVPAGLELRRDQAIVGIDGLVPPLRELHGVPSRLTLELPRAPPVGGLLHREVLCRHCRLHGERFDQPQDLRADELVRATGPDADTHRQPVHRVADATDVAGHRAARRVGDLEHATPPTAA